MSCSILVGRHLTVLSRAGSMAGYIPREVMPRVVPLMVRSLALDEQVGYVGIMRSAMRPGAFRAAAGWVGVRASDGRGVGCYPCSP